MEPTETPSLTPEEIEHNTHLRGIFCNLMMPVVEAYLPEVGLTEVLVVTQSEPTEEPKIMKGERTKLADVYDRFGAAEIANLLREPPVTQTAIICFNAYGGFKAFLVLRKGLEAVEA